VRKSMTAAEAEEVFLGPRLAAWLPEADWEWHDRVHSNLWPCELLPQRRTAPTPPTSLRPVPPEDER
jgi:hypothetical protein